MATMHQAVWSSSMFGKDTVRHEDTRNPLGDNPLTPHVVKDHDHQHLQLRVHVR